MNDTGIPKTSRQNELDPEQVQEVGGGNLCSADEFLQLTESFKAAYENLVDFTSHVIERVAGGPGTA